MTGLCQYLRNYWPIYNGLATDVVGGADLTSANPQFTADMFGQTNSALYITGSSNYWSAPSGAYFSSSYSITAWVKPFSFGNWARVMDFGDLSAQESVWLAYSGGTTGKPAFNVFQNGLNVYANLSDEQLILNTW